MNPLGLSFRQRITSRIVFYAIVFGGLELLNRLVAPVALPYESTAGTIPYVARAYHGVPLSEVEELLVRASR